MSQAQRIKIVLVFALVSSLSVGYRQTVVIANESSFDSKIALISVRKEDLETLKQDINTLQENINNLNSGLEKVVTQTPDRIDREKIDFSAYQNQFRSLKISWEALKKQLENSNEPKLKDLITKVEQSLKSIEDFLLPLGLDLIQPLEEFQKKQKDPNYQITIPELKDYQKKLFGNDSNLQNSDGIFGQDTQIKINEVLEKSVTEIDKNVNEIQKSLVKSSSLSIPPSPQGSQTLEERVKALEDEVAELKKKLNNTNSQNEDLNANGEITNPTDNPNPFLKIISSLLPYLLLITVVGGIGWKIYTLNSRNKETIREKDIFDSSSSPTDEEDDSSRSSGKSTLYSEYRPVEKPSNPPYNPPSVNHQISSGNYPPKEPPSNYQISPKVEKQKWLKSEKDLIDIYNKDSKGLQNDIIVATLTKDSIENQRAGLDSFPLFFQKSGSGNYWIVSVPELSRPYYYLVPKGKLTISKPTYESLKDMFVCHSYSGVTTNRFTLRKPAIVAYDELAGVYKLSEQGEIAF